MVMKYLNREIKLKSNVNWRYIDKKGKVISDETDICFREIMGNKIPDEVVKIVVYHPLSLVPYKADALYRWGAELTSLGFPMKVRVSEKEVTFTLLLHEYALKTHLSCSLTLIRCAYENCIAVIMENYFQILDQEKPLDIEARFAALQRAHVKACKEPDDLYCTPNTGHIVTYDGNYKTKPVSHKVFASRLKQTKEKIRALGKSDIHTLFEN